MSAFDFHVELDLRGSGNLTFLMTEFYEMDFQIPEFYREWILARYSGGPLKCSLGLKLFGKFFKY